MAINMERKEYRFPLQHKLCANDCHMTGNRRRGGEAADCESTEQCHHPVWSLPEFSAGQQAHEATDEVSAQCGP